ncbi:MAG: DUF6701 domain-containing protein [Pseudomonadota bacterium]
MAFWLSAAEAAISLRASASSTSTGAGQVDLPRVDGTGEGDLMLAFIMVEGRSTAQITDPAGWTRAVAINAGGSQHSLVVCFRFATVADVSGASPTWTWQYAGNHEFVASLLVFRGVDTANPIDASSNQSYTNNSATTTVPAVTPSVSDTVLVMAATINRGATFTWTAPAAEVTDARSGAGGGNIAMTTATDTGPAAGVSSGARTATASGSDNRRLGQMIALTPAAVPGPVLYWRFDESAWSGAADEVKDWSGNNLHGTAAGASGTATTTALNNGSPAFCRSGLFASGSDQYAETADHALLDITDRLTVTAWVRPASWPGAGLMTIASKDANYEFHLNTSGEVFWWWTAGANAITTTGTPAPVGAWTHVAIVFTRGAQEVYVNGLQAADNWTNPDRNALVGNALPFQVGSDQGFAGRFFGGQIDEVRIYNYAMSAADVLAVKNSVPAPLCPLDHFSVVPSGGASASTCVAKSLTITALDVNDAVYTPYAGTINLTTSTARGDWANGDGAGALANGAANDGAATYAFAAGDASDVVLGLSDQSQDDLTVSVADTAVPWATGTSVTVNFRDNAFLFEEDLAGRIAGASVAVAGRDHDLRVTYIYKDSVTANCGTLASYTGAKSVKAWVTRAGTDPGGAAPQIGAVALPDAAPGANNLNLTFAAGVASLDLSTSDVGKFALSLRDDAPVVANTPVSGASGDLTVRPFTIAASGIQQGAVANPGSDTPAGALFAAAGTSFEMTLGAYRHSAAADADDDGVPDAAATLAQTSAAGLAPSFAASASFSAVAPFAPAAGGTLNNAGAIAMTAGAANPTDLNFTEVGSFTLSTAGVVTSYLGTAGLDLQASVFDGAGAQVTAAPVVGRFRPDHFHLAPGATLVNRNAAACAPASSFSYMEEGLRLDFSLQARNGLSLPTVTANYAGAWAKLDPAVFASFDFGARSGATDLTSRLDPGVAPAGAWTNGVADVSALTAVLRAVPDNPDGPYAALQFGIAPVDSDGVAMDLLDLDADVNGSDERKSLGVSTEVRFGRLRVRNAVGAEVLPLRVPLEARYWNGSAFATNTLDSCTTLARDNIALEFSGAIAPCDTALSQASVTLGAGTAVLELSPPGPGNTGGVLLTPQLEDPPSGSYCTGAGGSYLATSSANRGYLTGRWSDSADPDIDPDTFHDDDPAARVGVGVYGAQPRNFIFFRENY